MVFLTCLKSSMKSLLPWRESLRTLTWILPRSIGCFCRLLPPRPLPTAHIHPMHLTLGFTCLLPHVLPHVQKHPSVSAIQILLSLGSFPKTTSRFGTTIPEALTVTQCVTIYPLACFHITSRHHSNWSLLDVSFRKLLSWFLEHPCSWHLIQF